MVVSRTFELLWIPLLALVAGGLCQLSVQTKMAGKLLLYFGGQSCMNLYVKSILSNIVISELLSLQGVPAPFFVTGVQQAVSFVIFVLSILVLSRTRWAYFPKMLSREEHLAMFLFSLSFVLNISLNNLSVSLIPLSVNLVIRCCLPISTHGGQWLSAKLLNVPMRVASHVDLLLMCGGVFGAALVIVSRSAGEFAETSNFAFGVFMALLSLLSGSVNLVLAGLLGNSLKLNPFDTAGYMAVPAALMLVLPTFFISHPLDTTKWPTTSFEQPARDVDIMQVALRERPSIIWAILLFGPLAFLYNVLQFTVVQRLSATHTAFAGNFNQAASIVIALTFGIDCLPGGYASAVYVAGITCNISAFTVYSVLNSTSKPASDSVARCPQLSVPEGAELVPVGHRKEDLSSQGERSESQVGFSTSNELL